MIIGYQGDQYSNSERAAKNFAEKNHIPNPEFRALITSRNVVQELKAGRIDYAVLAVKNTLGGTVAETFSAIMHEHFELAATEILQIHHNLYRHPDAKDSDILHIASHPQALKQTVANREKFYPMCDAVDTDDTALAAKELSKGAIAKDTAVLCNENAGEQYALHLMKKSMEDSKDNLTEFRIFVNSNVDYEHVQKPSLKDKFLYYLISEDGLGHIGKLITFLSAIVSLVLIRLLNIELWDGAEYLSGIMIFMFMLLTSNTLGNRLRYRPLVGYWKYYSLSDSVEQRLEHYDNSEQKFETPRLVRISLEDGKPIFRGFICDQENVPYFESTEVFISPYGQSNGHLVYWYANPNGMNRKFPISGIVELNWSVPHPASMINRMTGRYEGKATGDNGSVEYLRISEEEFYVHKNSLFL